ncbi:hypothetical protein K432DRAFT_386038 [Lepidopterella palustris CBS 459.81]|uniref:Uncharacterized protein n=1 Tax=Lepidopterella palustris CBS 459.81 TaxID=1314670 RepID=A0A8E2E1S6_9PEZI|nr:hypothetical protein K432DRAFT_386038 [Lepidopterella palustris CBS 459.81]
MTHRTRLWLTLIFDILRKTIRPTNKTLKAIIGTLPPTVEKVYEAILSKIEDNERPQARKLLYIIVAAARPYTLKVLIVMIFQRKCDFLRIVEIGHIFAYIANGSNFLRTGTFSFNEASAIILCFFAIRCGRKT